MSRIAIKENILQWAVNRSGLTSDALQRKFPKFRKWERGESQPTLRQLESLAKATLTPLGFFFLDEPPDDRLPIPHFRTVAGAAPGRPSADLLDSVQTMQRRQAWMREFLIEQGQDRLPFVKSAKLGDSTHAVTERMWRTLRLEDDWAAHQATWGDALGVLREAMETTGILAVINGVVGNNTRRKLDPNEFRGFVLVDEYAPLVFVNGADGRAAQMFTLAHELAHVFYGSSAAFDLREMRPADEPTEKACNQAAAEFLVPEHKLRMLWSSVNREAEPFQTMARRFKVSSIVAARRALDLRLITKAEFLDFYREYQRDERRAAAGRAEGGDFYATQNARVGRRFGHAVVRAVKEGRLLYSDAYSLTGLYGKAFERYADTLGFGGLQ